MSFFASILAVLILMLSNCCMQTSAQVNYTYFNVSDCMALFAGSVNIAFRPNDLTTKIDLPPGSAFNVDKSFCKSGKSMLYFSYANVESIKSLDVSLEFKQAGRYWVFSNSAINISCSDSKVCIDVSGKSLDMSWAEAPWGMGYKCTKPPPIMVKNMEGSAAIGIYFTSFQFQPFGVQKGIFGEANDCVGYFSIGAWSSIIVSLLLIAILSYGLIMLSSVQPYEMYDDPKKKLIQLGADN